jgi:hypothetical protein
LLRGGAYQLASIKNTSAPTSAAASSAWTTSSAVISISGPMPDSIHRRARAAAA